MLKNIFELAKNIVSKSLIVFKVFSEKIFLFFLQHWIFGLKAMFLPILLLNYYFAKKQGSKKDLI